MTEREHLAKTNAWRLMKFVEMVPESGCWIWMGALLYTGYGNCNARTYGDSAAHRVFFKAYHGEVPAGCYVLHTCDVRQCVNPDHLYAGSQSQNAKDAVSRGRHFWSSRDSCSRGHRYTPENTSYRSNGTRLCKECRRKWCKEYRRKKGASAYV